MKFETISAIIPSDPSTWKDRIFLTFDIDWAHDQILQSTIDLVEQAEVAATWFVTHDTALLGRLRANSNFELGIHPNFNFLLQGDSQNGSNAEEVIDRLLKIVPEAKSIRTHSLVTSSPLLAMFKEKGLTHDSSIFIPADSGININPYLDISKVIRCPYFFGDYSSCIKETKDIFFANDNLSIYDFHPIHVFLNTESILRYEKSRLYFNDPGALLEFRNINNHGVCDQLLRLLRNHH
jgi:hypothetical protein